MSGNAKHDRTVVFFVLDQNPKTHNFQVMQKVFGYVRVSTNLQQEDGASLAHQQERILAFAKANGHEMAGMFVETGSGSSAENRPELRKAMQAACRAKGILCVLSLSRFSRSVLDTLNLVAQLDGAGAEFCSITESINTSNAVGRLVFGMLSSLNQFEREMLVERTTNVLGHLRRQNKRTGCIPFGYSLAKDAETLLPIEAEQQVIQHIVRQRSEGKTLVEIADGLNAAGVRTKNEGKSWHGSTVASILRRQQLLAA
jgi:DNA invertase Pin-like site-specific DNA recombinase